MPVLFKNITFSPVARLLKAALPALFCISAVGCRNTSVNNNVKNTGAINTSLLSILGASIHPLILPFKDTCYDSIATQKVHLPDSLSKFRHYGQIAGKLNETKNYIAILYSIPADVQLPVLQTFDSTGKRISSLRLFIGNCCGENEDCSGISTVQITKDLHIILKDSTQTFERNKKKYNKKRNIRILKKYEEFEIDPDGKIVRVNNRA